MILVITSPTNNPRNISMASQLPIMYSLSFSGQNAFKKQLQITNNTLFASFFPRQDFLASFSLPGFFYGDKE